MMKMLTTFIKNRDVFCHQIVFGTKHGKEQTSILGGIVSLLIYILATVYVIIKGQKMFAGNLDIMTSTVEMTDFERHGKIKMNNLMPYLLVVARDDAIFDYLNV